jgi:hypothetical protein
MHFMYSLPLNYVHITRSWFYLCKFLLGYSVFHTWSMSPYYMYIYIYVYTVYCTYSIFNAECSMHVPSYLLYEMLEETAAWCSL